jgi:hypothetical protein
MLPANKKDLNLNQVLQTMNYVSEFSKAIQNQNLTDQTVDSYYFFNKCSKVVLENAQQMSPLKLLDILDSFEESSQ